MRIKTFKFNLILELKKMQRTGVETRDFLKSKGTKSETKILSSIKLINFYWINKFN